MKRFYREPERYEATIGQGLQLVRKPVQLCHPKSTVKELASALKKADAVIIGAGSGLSTSAGFTYSGPRFHKYFSDFAQSFGIPDMYSGGFYPFPDDETRWAWWARHIYFNRYVPAPRPVYEQLYDLVKDKEYFVITTNVDHQFQKARFDKKSLFYTQGDYGLFQSENPAMQETFDNEDWVMKAMEAQGFVKNADGIFEIPAHGQISMKIPSSLIPHTPDGARAVMNLRSDNTFVEDAGWHAAARRYAEFLQRYKDKKVLFLELGVGGNTPGIIKYPFWAMTAENPEATYACINYDDAVCPRQIEGRSICIQGDIGQVLQELGRV